MNMDLVQARQEPENVIPHMPVLHTKIPFTSVVGSFVAESGEFEAAADITSGAAHEAVLQTRKKLSVVHSQAVAAVRHRVQQDKINTLDEIFQAVILLAAFYSASGMFELGSWEGVPGDKLASGTLRAIKKSQVRP